MISAFVVGVFLGGGVGVKGSGSFSSCLIMAELRTEQRLRISLFTPHADLWKEFSVQGDWKPI